MSQDPSDDVSSIPGPEMRKPRKRIAEFSWFALLWVASLVVVSALAYAIRGVLL